MQKKKDKFISFLCIDLRTKDGDYKLLSVNKGADGSLYLPYSSSKYIKESSQEPNSVPIKYSRHSSGKRCRITVGPKDNRLAEFGDENKPMITDLVRAEGTIYISLSDVNNDIGKVLDKSDGRKNYQNRLVINAKNYSDLTIKVFIAQKDTFMQAPDKRYQEVHIYSLDGLYIIATAEDNWSGERNDK